MVPKAGGNAAGDRIPRLRRRAGHQRGGPGVSTKPDGNQSAQGESNDRWRGHVQARTENVSPGSHRAWLVHHEIGGQQLADYVKAPPHPGLGSAK